MKAIGFANKFFTLWDVQTEKRYADVNGQIRECGYTVNYTYYQNLSTDINKARLRFMELTGSTIIPEPDTELRGKTSSWKRVENFSPYLDTEFSFGKYCGKTFEEVNDPEYLYWAYCDGRLSDGNLVYAEPIMLAYGYVKYQGKIMTREEKKLIINAVKLQKAVDAENAAIEAAGSGIITIVMDRNISVDGFYWGYHTPIHFPRSKYMSYREFEYRLPVVDGKAKRVKGKTVELEVKMSGYNGQPMYEVIEVKSITATPSGVI